MFAQLAAIAIALGLIYYLQWRNSRRHMYELADKFPGEPGIPFFGNAFKLIRCTDHNQALETIYELSFVEKYKNVVKLWMGPKLFIGINHPKDIELVLGSSVHLKKSDEYRFFQPWFGNGLLISEGDVWRTHRKMIAPTFHLNVLKRFMTEFNLNSKRLIQRLESLGENEFDCHEYLSETMVETLAETVMGVKQHSKAIKARESLTYANAVMKMCDILHCRQIRIWLRPDILFRRTNMAKDNDKHLNIILNHTNKLIKAKKEDYDHKKISNVIVKDVNESKTEVKETEKFAFGQATGLNDDIDNDNCDIGEKRRLPFLESMIERAHNGDGMSDEEIRDQVNTLMFEGHDTTAAASSFFLAVLGTRPEIQEKCLQEVDSIFGNSTRNITFQDTLELKYLERCLLETLRLFPPVPMIARKIEQDIPLVSTNNVIPAGSTVIIGIFKVHRREDIYPNPEEFNPDNFLPENSASRHYYAFIPFSAGPRSCVGRKYAMLKLKILLANILRNFKVKKGLDMESWKIQADIILKRTDGFGISLERRKPGESLNTKNGYN